PPDSAPPTPIPEGSPVPRHGPQTRAHPAPRPSPSAALTSDWLGVHLVQSPDRARLYAAPTQHAEPAAPPTTPHRKAFASVAPGATPRPTVPRPRSPRRRPSYRPRRERRR